DGAAGGSADNEGAAAARVIAPSQGLVVVEGAVRDRRLQAPTLDCPADGVADAPQAARAVSVRPADGLVVRERTAAHDQLAGVLADSASRADIQDVGDFGVARAPAAAGHGLFVEEDAVRAGGDRVTGGGAAVAGPQLAELGLEAAAVTADRLVADECTADDRDGVTGVIDVGA